MIGIVNFKVIPIKFMKRFPVRKIANEIIQIDTLLMTSLVL